MAETSRNFLVGRTYLTQAGQRVKIIAESTGLGPDYLCVQGDDGTDQIERDWSCKGPNEVYEIVPGSTLGWRYDRYSDAGRCTGSAFDMSNPRNLIVGSDPMTHPTPTPCAGEFPQLPPAYATAHDDGHWTMPRGCEPNESRYAGWKEPVYSATQLHAFAEATVALRAQGGQAGESGEALAEIVLFGGDLKEVSWRKGRMPPVGTKLYGSPAAALRAQAAEGGKEKSIAVPLTALHLIEDAAQAHDQCRAVVHMALALANVYVARAFILAASPQAPVEIIGESSAATMEYLGDLLSNMDAVEEGDAWMDPIFEAAHTRWPVDQPATTEAAEGEQSAALRAQAAPSEQKGGA